ncbi:MAG: prepilin peptidase [Candidatus Cloacimonetes bacterium]|nr:prepilin peptidase [Candidatus Cloacimonadota bacterium]
MEIVIFKIILTTVFGLIFGSFFNVCIYRLPLKQSIAFPASHCPICKNPLKAYHNIPLLSYLFLKGRCHFCKTKISLKYPIIEFLTASMFLSILLWADYEISVLFFKYIIFFSFGLIIYFIDLEHKIIPDSLSIPLIIIGLILNFIPGNDIHWINSIIAALIGFVFFFLIAFYYAKIRNIEGMGGGDIKLITAIGAFSGVVGLFFTIFAASLIAIITVAFQRLLLSKPKINEIPFGPYLILGNYIYVLSGNAIFETYIAFIQKII